MRNRAIPNNVPNDWCMEDAVQHFYDGKDDQQAAPAEFMLNKALGPFAHVATATMSAGAGQTFPNLWVNPAVAFGFPMQPASAPTATDDNEDDDDEVTQLDSKTYGVAVSRVASSYLKQFVVPGDDGKADTTPKQQAVLTGIMSRTMAELCDAWLGERHPAGLSFRWSSERLDLRSSAIRTDGCR